MPRPDFEIRLREKMEPSRVRHTLARVGLVLLTYESVKAEVIDSVKQFYVWPGAGRGLDLMQARYKKEVLDRAPSKPYYASWLWLREMEVVTDADYEKVEALQKQRQAVAHDLVPYILDPDRDIDIALVSEVIEILRRIGNFWGRVSIDSDPYFEGDRDRASESVQSGLSVLLDFLVGVVERAE